MDAIELLKADHDLVDGLFREVEASGADAHAELFAQIKAELEAHAHVEETIFYPSLQEDGDEALVELVSEALAEHAQAKVILGELSAVSADAEKFEPLLMKLIEDVRHHVEEEEGTMFPAVSAQFEIEVLKRWGGQMQAEKENFESSADSAHA